MVNKLKSGLHDVPDHDGMDDEAFPPFPPPHSPGLGGQDGGDPFANGEEEGDVSKLAEVPAAKRKGVKRPQPKLDSTRLTSERGLPALRTLFDSVRFKGKGHEAENLRLMMQKMENWAHRLFPKLQFEDFIDKVEKLGNKKEVQTCLKRIRLDMPLTHEDFIGKDDEEEAAPEPHNFGDPDPFSGGSFPDELPGPLHSTPAPAAPPTPAAPSLTEEQRRRMELNRQRALERRLARQQQQEQTDPSDSQPVDSPLIVDEPSSVSSANVLNNSKDQEEEEEEEEMEVSDLQPACRSTQQPDQLSPEDPEPPEPSTLCETAESGSSPVHQPSSSTQQPDQLSPEDPEPPEPSTLCETAESSSSTQQPDELSPEDPEPPEPSTLCETAETCSSPVPQPSSGCDDGDAL